MVVEVVVVVVVLKVERSKKSRLNRFFVASEFHAFFFPKMTKGRRDKSRLPESRRWNAARERGREIKKRRGGGVATKAG